jgi:putative acetyltransferase
MTQLGTEIQIRMARAEDAPAIASVLERAFAEYAPLYTPEAYAATTPGIDELAARVRKGPVWLALQGEEAVGTVSALAKPEGLYIRSMAVLPSARGLGIGFWLLTEIATFAETHGCRRLSLSTTPFLHRAIHLYETFGFRRTGEGPHDLFGTPLLTMEKTVLPAAGVQLPDSAHARRTGEQR